MERMFRMLRADEIECRVATINKSGLSLLLYKDARVDQNLLDEVVGPARWQRRHELINGNLFCSVGIKFGDEWVWKQDVGTESNTEKEKGQASDAFKRACFNWGIGRELYTAPFIWIKAGLYEGSEKNGRWTTYDRFDVKKITIEDGIITGLVITNTKTGKVVYTYGKQDEKAEKPQKDEQKPQQNASQPVGPVTNETVRRAVEGGPQPDEQCGDIELATLEALTRKAYPNMAIEQIFPTWPKLTNAQYAVALQTMKSRGNRN